MKAYALANRFLTIIPWPAPPEEYGPGEARSALRRFPLVGLVMGLILAAGDGALAFVFPLAVRDAILIAGLIFLSGGVPLRAVGALADGLYGGGDSPVATPGGAAMMGILLLKFSVLLSLSAEGRWSALILAPTLGRAAMAYLLVQIPGAGEPTEEAGEFTAEATANEAHAAFLWSFVVCLVFRVRRGGRGRAGGGISPDGAEASHRGPGVPRGCPRGGRRNSRGGGAAVCFGLVGLIRFSRLRRG